jgi:hypothetical protein
MVDDTYALVTSVFFPVRAIDYTGEDQLADQAILNAISQESAKDTIRLNRFMKVVEREHGKLDRDVLKFRWVKDFHPRRSAYVRLLLCSMHSNLTLFLQ